MYLFHPRISQHLTNGRFFRRKESKPRVIRLKPNSQSAGHCRRDRNLWGHEEDTVFQGKETPSGFK